MLGGPARPLKASPPSAPPRTLPSNLVATGTEPPHHVQATTGVSNSSVCGPSPFRRASARAAIGVSVSATFTSWVRSARTWRPCATAARTARNSGRPAVFDERPLIRHRVRPGVGFDAEGNVVVGGYSRTLTRGFDSSASIAGTWARLFGARSTSEATTRRGSPASASSATRCRRRIQPGRTLFAGLDEDFGSNDLAQSRPGGLRRPLFLHLRGGQRHDSVYVESLGTRTSRRSPAVFDRILSSASRPSRPRTPSPCRPRIRSPRCRAPRSRSSSATGNVTRIPSRSRTLRREAPRRRPVRRISNGFPARDHTGNHGRTAGDDDVRRRRVERVRYVQRLRYRGSGISSRERSARNAVAPDLSRRRSGRRDGRDAHRRQLPAAPR